jgi:hypothetical protein
MSLQRWRHNFFRYLNQLTGTRRHFSKVAPDKWRQRQKNQVQWRQSFYLALHLILPLCLLASFMLIPFQGFYDGPVCPYTDPNLVCFCALPDAGGTCQIAHRERPGHTGIRREGFIVAPIPAIMGEALALGRNISINPEIARNSNRQIGGQTTTRKI